MERKYKMCEQKWERERKEEGSCSNKNNNSYDEERVERNSYKEKSYKINQRNDKAINPGSEVLLRHGKKKRKK